MASQTNGTDTLSYIYDSADKPYSVTWNGTTYRYELNDQGDVIGLVDSGNNEVVTYSYDAWGKVLNIGGSLAATVGAKNPLRYRGYYYDTETGVYYLQSRYYNPEWGRFISRDDQSYHDGESGAAANLYAYADNNPVMKSDPSGKFVISATAVAFAIDAILLCIPVLSQIDKSFDVIGLTVRAIGRYYGRKWEIGLYSRVLLKIRGHGAIINRIVTVIDRAVIKLFHIAINTGLMTAFTAILSNVFNLVPLIIGALSLGSIIATFLDLFSDGKINDKIHIPFTVNYKAIIRGILRR